MHEWHAGLLALAAAAAALLDGALVPDEAVIVAACGLWLLVKDWNDVGRTRRDKARWRLGLHRAPVPLRPLRLLDDVPAIAAAIVATVGIVDLVSAVTPNVSWRHRVLLQVEPVELMREAHALAVPVSFALILTAYYLYRRRSHALHVALALLAALTVFDLVKGLDVEEAALSAGAAGLLWAGRSSFCVRHPPAAFRAVLWRAPLLLAAGFLTALVAVAIAAPVGTPAGATLRETIDLLLWRPGPFGFADELARLGLAVELVSLLTVTSIAYVLFRPLAAPRNLPDPALRGSAARLVREHGTDTLAFFKLRGDNHYIFNEERTAFVGYRIESGVLVVSGDPVGEPETIGDLLATVVAFAEHRGLRIAALGVSPASRPAFEQAGLRAFYIGDEAIVDTDGFSLEGRAIRKVRQSVTRLEKAGYEVVCTTVRTLAEPVLGELEEVASDWRRGQPERGFCMAMDSLRNPHASESVVVYATGPTGKIGGFIHFVPAHGRALASLSLMCRRRDTPNGLTEFLIVSAIERLRSDGIQAVSLNFAAFGRLIRDPRGAREHLAARLIAIGDAWFQIERLYRFNAKFLPRWEPRYLMYERRLGLPRAGIAALWLEGQLPKPFPRSGRRARAHLL